jgi:hypothetical protein
MALPLYRRAVMSRAIPIRDLAGKIIGLKGDGEKVDPVQATIDASMKVVGVPDTTPTAPPSPPISRYRIAIGALIVAVWVVILALSAGANRPSQSSIVEASPSATGTLAPTATPSPTATVGATPTAYEEPTIVPEVPTVPAFSPPPPQAPVGTLGFCADRYSIWGKTHQCGDSQAAADALANEQIAAINATAEAINAANTTK